MSSGKLYEIYQEGFSPYMGQGTGCVCKEQDIAEAVIHLIKRDGTMSMYDFTKAQTPPTLGDIVIHPLPNDYFEIHIYYLEYEGDVEKEYFSWIAKPLTLIEVGAL